MIRDKPLKSLWPEAEPEDAGAWDTDALFENPHSRVGIRDRHGCTRWYGPIVMCIVLPQVGSTSLDLLQRADPHAFVDVVKLVLQVLKKRHASRELCRLPKLREQSAFSKLMTEAYMRWGREPPIVSRTFKRLVDGSLWCAVLALPELSAVSESQILRSLGLTVDEARRLVVARKTS